MGRANAVLLLLLLLEGQRPQLSSRPLAALGRAGRQISNPPSRVIVDILRKVAWEALEGNNAECRLRWTCGRF